ncbi:MAG: SPOR domain-containing protein [Nitrospirae bacterium]|nr:SPOR domain-containing protein [Nitrospirota bacterium]
MPGESVLIIEDDTTAMRELTGALRSAGYLVAVTASGAEGLRKAEALAPSIVFVSVALPGEYFTEICTSLREFFSPIDIPVIAVVPEGRAFDVSGESLAKYGIVDHVKRPVDPADVQEKARLHLGAKITEELQPAAAPLPENIASEVAKPSAETTVADAPGQSFEPRFEIEEVSIPDTGVSGEQTPETAAPATPPEMHPAERLDFDIRFSIELIRRNKKLSLALAVAGVVLIVLLALLFGSRKPDSLKNGGSITAALNQPIASNPFEEMIGPDELRSAAPPVEADTGETGTASSAKRYTVQLGAFVSRENAERAAQELARRGWESHVLPQQFDNGRVIYRLLIGQFLDQGTASVELERLKAAEGMEGIVTTL